MADNVNITAGTGTAIAADEVVDGTLGTVKVGYVKIMDGDLDSTTKYGTTNPFPVSLKAGTAVAGKVGIDQTTPGTTNGVQVNAALPAGTNVIGKVTTDQTTHGTTDLVAADVTKVGGTAIDTNSGTKSAGTQRIVIATDQPAFTTPMPVSQNAATSVSGTLQNVASATGNGSTISTLGMSSVVFTVSGTWSGTINFEGTEDGSTYSAISVLQMGTSTIATTTTGNGVFEASCAGLQNVRARLTWSSGTSVTVTAHTVPVAWGPRTVNANIVSNTATNQSTNLAQVGGASIAQGHGTAAAAIRVELPTDGTGVVGLNAGTALIGQVSASDETSTIYSGTTALTPTFATLTASASGVTNLVALVSSKKIRVLALSLIANGSVNVKFQSHVTPTDISGLYYLAANVGFVLPYNPLGWFQTVSGEALDINLSAAVAVGGNIVYVSV